MDPEDFIYYRQDKADEERVGPTMDHRYTFKEVKPMLAANVRSFPRSLERLLKGERVNTRFGTYWAEPKEKLL